MCWRGRVQVDDWDCRLERRLRVAFGTFKYSDNVLKCRDRPREAVYILMVVRLGDPPVACTRVISPRGGLAWSGRLPGSMTW